ncbi:MAG: hypothetical protein NDJ94_03545 [Vicinamibacteria bacterium]|nr:hypothetical protein [Vicinamibacteria bacterium]
MASPPRLHVLLARDTPIGLILRRGPTQWYHLIRWHTDTDALEPGAWFRGRLYEERCDLSPDGKLFLYFALQGRKFGTSYTGSWTAVSRAPWLHALALWPHGSTWGGGGYFAGRRQVVVFGGDLRTHPDHPAIGLEVATGWRPATFRSEEWAGRDHAGDIVFTREGRLFRTRAGRIREIADFRDLAPDPQPAPAWARAPLTPWSDARPRKPGGRKPGGSIS